MKKALALILTLLLCFSLTGCKSLEEKREEAIAAAEVQVKAEANKTPQIQVVTLYEEPENAFVILVALSHDYYTDYIEQQYSNETDERKELLTAAMMRVMENNNGSDIEEIMSNLGNAVKEEMEKVELRTIVAYIDLDEEVKYRIEL